MNITILILRINTTIVSLQHDQGFQQHFFMSKEFSRILHSIGWLHPMVYNFFTILFKIAPLRDNTIYFVLGLSVEEN